ncbi:Protein of unknown function [Pyronema omphalodes CBS 100304]|uniref:Uncharacterized protein n=1 Tax=Pyronema omphalodes (strain CBS 100304) TaxID=1076935 RepID=U4L965_PYROM|nr:Protein of unknown function [Pyronema omphalodes CBS 100304]
MPLNKPHTYVSYKLQVMKTLPEVRVNSSTPISPPESTTRIPFEAGTKSPAPHPAKEPTTSTDQKTMKFPRSATGIKPPGGGHKFPPPVPRLPHLSNSKRDRSGTVSKRPADLEEQPFQGPKGHPALVVPRADYYRMERPPRVRQASHGHGHGQEPLQGLTGHSFLLSPNADYYRLERRRQAHPVSHSHHGHGDAPLLHLPKLPAVPYTAVFAGSGFGEGAEGEGRSPLLSPPGSLGQDSGFCSSGFDITPTTPGFSGADIELTEFTSSDHRRPKTAVPHASSHPAGPHRFRANHKPSLASLLLLATGLDQPQADPKPSFGFLFSPSGDQQSLASLYTEDTPAPILGALSLRSERSERDVLKLPSSSYLSPPLPSSLKPSLTSLRHSTASTINRCPFILSHLHLSTHTGFLSTRLLTSLHQLRHRISEITRDSPQRYVAYNRLAQCKLDVATLEANIGHLRVSFETLVLERRLGGLHIGVRRAIEDNLGSLENEGREVGRVWGEVWGRWEEMTARGAGDGGWWGWWWPGGECCGV